MPEYELSTWWHLPEKYFARMISPHVAGGPRSVMGLDLIGELGAMFELSQASSGLGRGEVEGVGGSRPLQPSCAIIPTGQASDPGSVSAYPFYISRLSICYPLLETSCLFTDAELSLPSSTMACLLPERNAVDKMLLKSQITAEYLCYLFVSDSLQPPSRDGIVP